MKDPKTRFHLTNFRFELQRFWIVHYLASIQYYCTFGKNFGFRLDSNVLIKTEYRALLVKLNIHVIGCETMMKFYLLSSVIREL